MKLFFNKQFQPIGILLCIVAVYLVVRLFQLGNFPIFTDEAIYIRWAQIASQDASWRFISLTDGKQPMYVWIGMMLVKLISDPLIAGRMVSVIAGFFSVIGLYFAGREIFKNHWVGLVSAFLYVVYPFAIVYDRMALYDSLVGAFAIWSLYLSFVLFRRLRLDTALILSMVIGGGVLTKTNAFFSLALLPGLVLLTDLTHKDKLQRFFRFFGLYFLVVVLALGYYSILRLSPFFHIITEKNALFVYPIQEWLKHPFTYFESNFFGLWDWFWKYMTLPWVGLALFSIFSDKKFVKEKLLLIIWFLVPFIYLSFFGKNIYPRFIFFMTLSLLPLVAYSLIRISELIKNKAYLYVLLGLFFVWPLYADYFIFTNFAKAPIPKPDIQQYYTEWPSGLGVREAVAFFEKEAKKGKIYIATEGTFGLMPYALEIYLVNNPNIEIKGYWPINAEIPKEILEAQSKYPTYFLTYQPCGNCKAIGAGPITWPLKQILQIEKQEGTYLTVFQITP